MESDDEKEFLGVEDLLSAYSTEPKKWQPRIYVYESLKPTGKTPGDSLGPPVQLPSDPKLIDEQEVWRGVAARLGGTGRAIVRLVPVGGGPGQLSGVMKLSELLWSSMGLGARKPETITMPTSAPAPAQTVAPAPLPPTDLIGVLMTSMSNQNAFMMKMMEMNAAPRADPAIAALQAENARLQSQLREPARLAKEEREAERELGQLIAEKGSGTAGAVATLLTGPLNSVAEAIKDAVKVNSDIAKINAEIRLAEVEMKQMELAMKAQAAGVPLAQLAKNATPDQAAEQPVDQAAETPLDDTKSA